MKFNRIALSCLLGIVALSHTANATRARLQALGQDKNGSLFIEDERNIFLNPAYITKVPNQINLEAGNANRVNGGVTSEPKAEGGVVYQTDNSSLGVQLGRVSKAADQIDAQPSLAGIDFYDPQNGIDLIIGSGDGLAWGGSLHYASSSSKTGATADFPDSDGKILSARGGILTDSYQAYLNFDAIHESRTQRAAGVKEEYEGAMSLELGGSFNINEVSKVGGYVLRTGNDFDNGAAIQGDYELTKANLSYFYNFKKEEDVMVFGIAGVYFEQGKSDFEAAGTDPEKQDFLTLPVGLGFESRMATWLKLRGSVTQNVLIDQDEFNDGTGNLQRDGEDDTVVTIGSSVTFNSFTLDATLEGSGSAGSGRINGNTLMSNVGLTYGF